MADTGKIIALIKAFGGSGGGGESPRVTVRETTKQGVDLDITDTSGNVIMRLADGNIKTKNFDSSSLNPYVVPDYYLENGFIDGKLNRVKTLFQNAEGLVDGFAFITDMHWSLNAKNSPALLKYIRDNTRIDKFFCGGDVCDYINTEYNPYNAFANFQSALDMPIYTTPGNHDYMGNDGTEGYVYYAFNAVGRDRQGYLERNFFYIDNPQSQIRYVFLNGFMPDGEGSWEFGLEEEQIDWLTETAMDVEHGWGIVIITHMIYGVNFDNMQIYQPETAINLIEVLDAYEGNGEIIAIISGHAHFDYRDTTPGGIPIFVTTCDKNLPWIRDNTDMEPWLDERTAGTTKEQAIDIFTINRGQRLITRVRIGCPLRYGISPTPGTDIYEDNMSYGGR